MLMRQLKEQTMTKLEIQGMTCGHCQRAVKEALEGVSGVTQADVSLDEHRATVEGDADVQSLIAAVQEEGYQASVAS
jgi:copper chaperone